MLVEMINIEVAYAMPERQAVLQVQVPLNSSVETAILSSGILELFPEIDLASQKVGIFSQICSLTTKVEEGNRIEIYRALTIDPKQARLKRVVKKVKKVRFN